MPSNLRYLNQNPPIASYDWQDISSGTGYQIFNAMTVWTTTTEYILSDNTNVHTYSVRSSTAENTNTTYNFDIQMNTSKYIKGNIIFQVPNYVINAGTGDLSVTTVVGVYKWDGATETQIGSSITKSFTGITGEARLNLAVGKIVATGTTIASGEYIRLKINVACQDSDNSNSSAGFFHDPKETEDLSATYVNDLRTSRTLVAIPFKLF